MQLQKPTCPYAGKAAARAWGQGFELLPLTTSSADYDENQRQAWAEGRACRAIALAQAAQQYATAPTYDEACSIYANAVETYTEAEVQQALAECPIGIPWDGTPSRPKFVKTDERPGIQRVESPPDFPTADKFPMKAPWEQAWTHEQFAIGKNTARKCALMYGKPYTYTPKTAFEANRWEPHHWVLVAMQRAYLAGQQSNALQEDVAIPAEALPLPWQRPADTAAPDTGLDMRSPVVRLMQGDTTPKAANALHRLDKAIAEAVAAYKDSDAPQGLLVALLHGHAHSETAAMLA